MGDGWKLVSRGFVGIDSGKGIFWCSNFNVIVFCKFIF